MGPTGGDTPKRRQARPNAAWSAGALILLVTVLAACPFGESSDSQKTLSGRLNAAGDELKVALDDYLASRGPSNVESQTEWLSFFDVGARKLERIRALQTRWASILDDVIDQGLAGEFGYDSSRLRQYRDAAAEWLNVQEEQLRESRRCWYGTDPATCYTDLITRRGSYWQSVAQRLNELSGALRRN